MGVRMDCELILKKLKEEVKPTSAEVGWDERWETLKCADQIRRKSSWGNTSQTSADSASASLTPNKQLWDLLSFNTARQKGRQSRGTSVLRIPALVTPIPTLQTWGQREVVVPQCGLQVLKRCWALSLFAYAQFWWHTCTHAKETPLFLLAKPHGL